MDRSVTIRFACKLLGLLLVLLPFAVQAQLGRTVVDSAPLPSAPFPSAPLRERAVQAQLGKTVVDSARLPSAPLRERERGVQAALGKAVVELAKGEAIEVQRLDSAGIRLDGQLTEAFWRQLPAYDEFVIIEPDTLAQPSFSTRVRLFYDKTGIYFGIDMDQPEETLVSRLSGRDDRGLSRDSINITMDTSGEGRYGYWFGINLGDSLMDGTLLPERQFSTDWDGAWRGKSHKTANGWSAEFHIPWSTVAMPLSPGKRRIGLYMSRKVAHLDERWAWPGLPSTVPKFISVLQTLHVQEVDPKQQFSIFPFTAVTEDGVESDVRYRLGADFFWRPSTNFQLTATANPDFGGVESDNVSVNLSATETFFPEKRLFFLEGQQVFVTSPRADTRNSSGVGNTGSPTTLINTRRIGGQPRLPDLDPGVEIPQREELQPVDLIGAVKMTGQYERLRFGAMAAFEDEVEFAATRNGAPFNLEGQASDYGVVRVLYEDEPGGPYRALGFISTAALNPLGDAKTHGLDVHYLSAGGQVKMDVQTYISDLQGEQTGYGGFIDFEYTPRKGLTQRLGIEYNDEHVDINHLGYLARNGNFRIRSAHIRTSSNLGWARDNQFDIRGFVERNHEGLFSNGGIFLSDRLVFNNLSTLVLRLRYFPEVYDDLSSFGNGAFRTEESAEFTLSWSSDASKPFSYGFGYGLLAESLGGRTQHGSLRANWRPSDRFGLSAQTWYWNRDGWLLHQEDRNLTSFQVEQWSTKLSADYFINARQQFRFSLQWVGIKAEEDTFYLVPDQPGDLLQVAKPAGPDDSFSHSRMSMQLRYRWELAPLSDVFLVYTRFADDRAQFKGFRDVFSDSYGNPIADLLVLKLRYRFGS